MYQDETLRNEGIPLFSFFFKLQRGSIMILILLTGVTRRLGILIFAHGSSRRVEFILPSLGLLNVVI